METAAHKGREVLSAREEAEGVGVVVENVAWGPRGRGVVVAWVLGWAMRVGLLVVVSLCMVVEVRGWQEERYPFPLQCFLCVVGVVGVVVMLWLMVTNPCEVEEQDVLKVHPREGVTWTWCSHCHLLRPAGSVHCFLCHRCIADIHHHCLVLWRCIGKKSLPAYITLLGAITVLMLVNFIMIKEVTVRLDSSAGNYIYIIASPLLFLLTHSILSLGSQHKWSPPQVHPSSAFVVRAPLKLSGVAPFTFIFSEIPSRCGELLRIVFRPLAAWKASPKTKKVKQLFQCPNYKCRAVANPFWVAGDNDQVLECNICEAAYAPSQDTQGTLLDHDLLSEMNVQCLVRDDRPRPRPRLVFVLDATVPDVRTCIYSWAAAAHALPDLEVLCYETRTCRLYSDGKAEEHTLEGRRSLCSLVERAWKEVASRGGRMVFISGREKQGLKIEVLEALVEAASKITLNMVCVSKQGVDRNPLLQPLIMHHQARGGGSTRLVERVKDVLKLVQSGNFLFWGVKARGRAKWTPGVEVVEVHGMGVTSFDQNTDSFAMACLDQEKQVEFSLKVDEVKVLGRRRISDPEDNTVYFQLQMLYTNCEGKAVLCVFNRMFSVDDGLNGR